MTVTIAKNERVVLISGCSAGGIGHHLALELAAHGCRVFAGVRTLSKAQTLVDNPRIEAVELDITDDASVDAAIAYVLAATGGRIDMLVNNAGVLCAGPAVEAPLAEVQQVFDTNVVGLARLCRAVAPVMMDRRQGTIVNVGSVSGYVATPWVGFYAASKAAVHAYSDSLRMELAPFGVNVVVVAPGSIKSNLVVNHGSLFDNNSRYELARSAIEARAALSQASDSAPADKFARVVVPQMLCSSPSAYITCGTHSAATWFLYYVPPVIRDYIFGRRFGTHQLAKDLQSAASGGGGACPVSGKKGGSGGGCPMSGRAASVSCPIASPAAMWVALAAVVVGGVYTLFKS
ncbi:hypothetical protein GGH94_000548 [Coemansia aciculifera]|uniref:Ketoreductase domain-containing protein n=1 Tax=Coemansia aciculifera TaxID=417176 RepID=A0A9W8ISK4_9FUNG|nr:hypothetical protein GGH94_000548 [Coemansia aciculifera]KAJ2876819.1 hypothetical protein GGH93_000412 [Coemansia aciculifera]